MYLKKLVFKFENPYLRHQLQISAQKAALLKKASLNVLSVGLLKKIFAYNPVIL